MAQKQIRMAVNWIVVLLGALLISFVGMATIVKAGECKPRLLHSEDIVIDGRVFVFLWGDMDCDGNCDHCIICEYLGKDKDGKPILEPLRETSCKTGVGVFRKLQEEVKKNGS